MANKTQDERKEPDQLKIEESGQPLLNAWREAIRTLKSVTDEQAQHERRTKDLAERFSVATSEASQAERAFKDWLNSR